jgi:hypothetical protein
MLSALLLELLLGHAASFLKFIPAAAALACSAAMRALRARSVACSAALAEVAPAAAVVCDRADSATICNPLATRYHCWDAIAF